VAAFNAASCKKSLNGGEAVSPISVGKVRDGAATASTRTEPSSSSGHWRALAASRSLVARLFHLPSSSIKSHPHPDVELIRPSHPPFPHSLISHAIRPPQPSPSSREGDSVLYPIVGFRFVRTHDGETIALPTTCHAACRLPLHVKKEEVVGWYSPACKLDPSSDDGDL
jgi:hypothetical protein